jgi:hypothetical protein
MQIRRRSRTAPGNRGLALTCDGCGATTTTSYSVHPVTVPDAPVDNCFGLPLWLQTPCAGHTLWAFNARHLAYLNLDPPTNFDRSGCVGHGDAL